jgi:hypothetical protein
MLFEVVAVVSTPTEAEMLRDNLIDRQQDLSITVLLRPNIDLPAPNTVQLVSIGTSGLGELALQAYARRARSGWLLRVDPDERWPEEAFHRARELVGTLDESEVAAFPMTYFVGARPLRGGPWSGNYYPRLHSAPLLTRSAVGVHLPPAAHRVRKVPLTTPVQHFWIRDLAHLRAKHDHYLQVEGAARTIQFGRYRTGIAALQVARAVGRCIRSAPWKDGVLGTRLATEMIRYQWKANAAWRREGSCCNEQ